MPSASSNPDREALLVIIGPTAVGKTKLSLELAQSFRGEIISGDSMQVYRYMDIGTAKASPEERKGIPHHLIDRFDPDYPFSVEEFQRLADELITEINKRGHLPMLVGGTGLYVQAVTHGYRLPGVQEDPAFREEMHRLADEKGNQALHARLQQVDPEAAERLHPNDRRRTIRALEIHRAMGKPLSQIQRADPPDRRTLWIGLTMPRELLYQRIDQRVDQMMEQGLLDEVAALRRMGYDTDLVSMQALGYKELMMHLKGEMTLEEAVRLIKGRTRKFAKRQLSWFRRLTEIHWFDMTDKNSGEEIRTLVAGNFPRYQE
ncbi:MAG: tRNA (adenosine(37)-N6)-dimethylallyltransferase MiaA [Firmicutes bacterium]|nr:tRNA (adenosine(37)-N6)-dimethylallyltransferase MiaA [Bacillota bacterium]